MTKSHWLTLALLLAAISGLLGGLEHWSDLLHPSFMAGLLGVLAAVIRAMFQDTPTK